MVRAGRSHKNRDNFPGVCDNFRNPRFGTLCSSPALHRSPLVEPPPQTFLPASRSASSCWFHADPTIRTRDLGVVTGLSQSCHKLSHPWTRTSIAGLCPPPSTPTVVPPIPDLGKPSRVCASPHLTQLRPVMTAARVPPADRVFAAPDLPPCSADSDANLPSPELADAQTSLMHPLMNTTLRLRSVRTAHLPQMGPCVPRHLDISRQRPF